MKEITPEVLDAVKRTAYYALEWSDHPTLEQYEKLDDGLAVSHLATSVARFADPNPYGQRTLACDELHVHAECSTQRGVVDKVDRMFIRWSSPEFAECPDIVLEPHYAVGEYANDDWMVWKDHAHKMLLWHTNHHWNALPGDRELPGTMF